MLKIITIFFILISQISYSQLNKNDIEKFEELSNKTLLIDDILVHTYQKRSKEVSPSFLEVVNEEQKFLIVADKKYHRFIPMFYQRINNEVSIYIILQHEIYSNSKYVYALIFKNNKCINLRHIYCNSDIYKPPYDKNFGAQLKGDTIRLFDINSGFFESFKIHGDGGIEDVFSEITYSESIYNIFQDYYTNNSCKLNSEEIRTDYKVLFPLTKVNIKTYNVIPLPMNVFTKSYESYFISKESTGKITKIYYLNKCILTNGTQESIVVREVYDDDKNIKIDNKLD